MRALKLEGAPCPVAASEENIQVGEKLEGVAVGKEEKTLRCFNREETNKEIPISF